MERDRGSACADLLGALGGDMAALERVRRQPHDVLLRCQAAHGAFLLPPAAVGAVLAGLRAGTVNAAQAHAWALFMRVGYVAHWSYADLAVARAEAGPERANSPVRPLDIDFDPAAEDAIAEVLARLDDIGDPVAEAIFGPLTADEIDALLDSLRSP